MQVLFYHYDPASTDFEQCTWLASSKKQSKFPNLPPPNLKKFYSLTKLWSSNGYFAKIKIFFNKKFLICDRTITTIYVVYDVHYWSSKYITLSSIDFEKEKQMTKKNSEKEVQIIWTSMLKYWFLLFFQRKKIQIPTFPIDFTCLMDFHSPYMCLDWV